MKLSALLVLLLLAFLSASRSVDASAARTATPKRRLGGKANPKEKQAAITSRQLKKAAEGTKKKIPKDAVKYGQHIFLQAGGHYRRILIGCRGKKKDDIYSLDLWAKKIPDLDSKWEILSYSKDGGGVPDDCVRYGDRVLFKQVKSVTYPYLGLGVDSGERDTRSWKWNNDEREHEKYSWVIRSNPGKTGDAKVTDDDPANGICVVDMSKTFIQSRRTNNRWLKGAHGNNNDNVSASDIFNGAELEQQGRYMWIIRKDKGLGHEDGGIQCLAKGATGVWKKIGTATGGDYTLTYTEGVTRTTDRSETKEKNWSRSVSATVDSNFAFGSLSTTLTGDWGGSASTTVSDSLARNEDVSHSTTWYEKGVIWQYAIQVKDLCVPSWEVTTNEVFMTRSMNEPPCCLPGQFYDLERPHGPCIEGSPCQCDEKTCNTFEEEIKAVKEAEKEAEAEEEDNSSDEDSTEEEDSYEEESDSDEEYVKGKKLKSPNYVGSDSGSDSGEGSPSYDGEDGDIFDDDDAWLQQYMGTDGEGFYYDDDLSYGDDGAYFDDYYDDDYAMNGAYGGMPPLTTPPKFMYNGGGPLFSLNINQANTNNNGAGFTPQGGDLNVNNDPYYGYPDDSEHDEDFSFDDDAQNDDYLDIVEDAIQRLGDEEENMGRRNLRRRAQAQAE